MDQDDDYQIQMPFVVAESNGGPLDDLAYVAGWEAAALANQLQMLKGNFAATVSTMVHTVNMPQIDLIAMTFGFSIVGTTEVEAPDGDSTMTWVTLSNVPNLTTHGVDDDDA